MQPVLLCILLCFPFLFLFSFLHILFLIHRSQEYPLRNPVRRRLHRNESTNNKLFSIIIGRWNICRRTLNLKLEPVVNHGFFYSVKQKSALLCPRRYRLIQFFTYVPALCMQIYFSCFLYSCCSSLYTDNNIYFAIICKSKELVFFQRLDKAYTVVLNVYIKSINLKKSPSDYPRKGINLPLQMKKCISFTH